MTDLTVRLRALADAATPGPWDHSINLQTHRSEIVVRPFNQTPLVIASCNRRDKDAEFIAAARQGVVELCDEVERLEQVVSTRRPTLTDVDAMRKRIAELEAQVRAKDVTITHWRDRAIDAESQWGVTQRALDASNHEVRALEEQRDAALAVEGFSDHLTIKRMRQALTKSYVEHGSLVQALTTEASDVD